MSTPPTPYRTGESDAECRTPVIVGDGLVLGLAYRWHRTWHVVTSEGETNLNRPPTGEKGIDMAARHLIKAHAAGHITPVRLTKVPLTVLYGPVPLLDPRMPVTARNTESAHKAFAQYARHDWRALTGFPGSDNHQLLLCERCGWIGPRYYSHLRGRNGGPPPAQRHEPLPEGGSPVLPWVWQLSPRSGQRLTSRRTKSYRVDGLLDGDVLTVTTVTEVAKSRDHARRNRAPQGTPGRYVLWVEAASPDDAAATAQAHAREQHTRTRSHAPDRHTTP
ncbi:hypothetical protein GCM10010329_82680 [Streptomyces spiroverticillatus]|uniref:Uncharacterized protein n=1 Tax=Streptomyces finlayi TaxID=67296 RepID=A0A918X8R1_9ACTN|nr:hypothetical protein [Streptomyces finlayi]GHA47735.1 hypothetical protein GCM10010329_82680 [Streptomyces spiroverticillatus]GHD18698.1 hypothetical protein GCM10010334_81750 [Streptomyces finlayi]